MAYSEKTYFELRSTLDAFETMALSYCLNAKDDEEAQKRMYEIKSSLRDKMSDLKLSLREMPRALAEAKCPKDAPYYCNGDCLPYPCPQSRIIDSNEKS